MAAAVNGESPSAIALPVRQPAAGGCRRLVTDLHRSALGTESAAAAKCVRGYCEDLTKLTAADVNPPTLPTYSPPRAASRARRRCRVTDRPPAEPAAAAESRASVESTVTVALVAAAGSAECVASC